MGLDDLPIVAGLAKDAGRETLLFDYAAAAFQDDFVDEGLGGEGKRKVDLDLHVVVACV